MINNHQIKPSLILTEIKKKQEITQQLLIEYSNCKIQSQEPILLPKLRIRFADFPYLRSFHGLEAIHLGDLLRILVRTENVAFLLNKQARFSRFGRKHPDISKSSRCSTSHLPLALVDPILGEYRHNK
jgi:hypothetical protein